MTRSKALIAMSGGVDSSVAAHLILQQNMDCIGGTMQLFDSSLLPKDASVSCGSLDSAQDAAAVAHRLGFDHYVFDFSQDFRSHVVDPFVRCYEEGATPNPCIRCNRHLKFARLLEQAKQLDCEFVVTGHYARIRREGDRFLMYKAADTAKDQTYVLYTLTQQQLAHVLLPLGELTKEQVRAIAAEQGFLNANKKDSQDICFIPDGDYVAFMKRYTGKHYPEGDFLDLDGKVVGRHRGAVAYTLGQRKGLGLAMGAPVYVCSKDMERNTVTVGPNEALFSKSLLANDWNWFPFPTLTEPLRVTAKARYRHIEQPATVYPEADGFARVEFDEPQRALTPGQAVVLYQGDLVIGGGTITDIL